MSVCLYEKWSISCSSLLCSFNLPLIKISVDSGLFIVQQQACAGSVYCACCPDLAACGGVYVNGCVPCPPSTLALDSVAALRLYTLNVRILERVLGYKAFSLSADE